MRKSFFVFFTLAFAAQAWASAQDTPLPGQSLAIVSDHQGGTCHLEAIENGKYQFRRHPVLTASAVVVRSDDPVLSQFSVVQNPGQTNEYYSFACHGDFLYFLGFESSGAASLFRKDGQLTQLLRPGVQVNRITPSGVVTSYFVRALWVKAESGRLLLGAVVKSTPTATGNTAVTLELTSSGWNTVVDPTTLNMVNASAVPGCMLGNSFYQPLYYFIDRRLDVYRIQLGKAERVISVSRPDVINQEVVQIACGSDDALVAYSEGGVRNHAYFTSAAAVASRTVVDVPVLSNLQWRDRMLYGLSAGALVEVRDREVRPLITGVKNFVWSGSALVYSNSANQAFVRLYPSVTDTSGKAGDLVTLPCVGCFWSNIVNPELKVAGVKTNFTKVQSGLQFLLPSTLSGKVGIDVLVGGNIYSAIIDVFPIPPPVDPNLPKYSREGLLSVFGRKSPSSCFEAAPGNIISLYGEKMANGEGTTPGTPWPTEIAGVKVLWNGVPTPLHYISPIQVNFQVPFNAVPGTSATLVVMNGDKRGPEVSVQVRQSAPCVLGGTRSFLFTSAGNLIDDQTEVERGIVLTAYATGLGQTFPPSLSGVGASVSPLQEVERPRVTLDGVPANVFYAGLTPFFVGLYQLNVEVPRDLPISGDPVIRNGIIEFQEGVFNIALLVK